MCMFLPGKGGEVQCGAYASLENRQPITCLGKQPLKDTIMRKMTAIAAALGFLVTTSLTPVVAAPAIDTGTTTDLSAAKKKAKKSAKKAKAKKKKAAELSEVTDLSAAKKKAKKGKKAKAKSKKKKMGELSVTTDLSAAKKGKKSAKKAKAKKKKVSNVIEYRIAA